MKIGTSYWPDFLYKQVVGTVLFTHSISSISSPNYNSTQLQCPQWYNPLHWHSLPVPAHIDTQGLGLWHCGNVCQIWPWHIIQYWTDSVQVGENVNTWSSLSNNCQNNPDDRCHPKQKYLQRYYNDIDWKFSAISPFFKLILFFSESRKELLEIGKLKNLYYIK